MSVLDKAQRKAASIVIDQAVKRMEKDPQKGMLDMLDFAQKMHVFDDEKFEKAKKMAQDPENHWTKLAIAVFQETDPHILRQTILNVGYQASMYGSKIQREIRKELGTNVPWTILFDPTSACNLQCTGCWAAEYGHTLNLTYEEMDDLVTQGKGIGSYFYLVTGGEPLMRKKDLIRLAEKHNDCAFHIFTNGTLIDEAFCDEVKRVGNMSFAISLEGFEEANDSRRGDGVYHQVLDAMTLMKEKGLIFGASVCYTSVNYQVVTSDEFMQLLVDHGVRLAWYFHYMPVGHDAAPELLLNPDQREWMVRRIRSLRGPEGKFPIAAIDFQNDGQFINGCIAGGKDYLHVNARGDVEPCVFIHYSSANIRTHTLKEALAQPLFMAYKDHQPFNQNHFRPCPMLENPQILREMVHESGAQSTDLIQPEDVEHLCSKCDPYAAAWRERAETLWEEFNTKK